LQTGTESLFPVGKHAEALKKSHNGSFDNKECKVWIFFSLRQEAFFGEISPLLSFCLCGKTFQDSTSFFKERLLEI